MDETSLRRFKTLLQEAKEALEADLTQLQAEAAPVSPDVSLGRLTRQEALQAQSVAKESLHQREIRLRLVQAALRRVADGSYGECLECGETIATDRLEIQPEAALCVRCAQLRQG
jgi:DnaK suppressor protein